MQTMLNSAREAIPLNLYRVSSPGLARVVSNERLTPPGHEDVRHIVLDLSALDYRYLEGQSLGVLPPGHDERGHPHKLRLYSIASARRGDDGRGTTASLCVKRVVYDDPASGRECRGVASNYLCDLSPGDEVRVTGPAGKTFLLPDDPSAHLILVATGTGIAPFRAFLRRIERDRHAWTGGVSLFFGVRTAAECLYRDELDALLDGHGHRRAYAFSREQTTSDGRRLYVQHRMAEQVDELRALLDRDNTFLYICGLKGMEDGIAAVFDDRARVSGVAPGSFEDLRRSGRVFIETY